MRYTELWARLEGVLGPAYAGSWATTQVIGTLGSRTVVAALDDGYSPQEVWRAVWDTLGLPASER